MKKKPEQVSMFKGLVKELPASPPALPPLPPVDPELRRKENEKWFKSLNESVPTIPVVQAPLAGPPITVIPGFTVPCNCIKNPMYTPPLPGPVCKSCGGKGFVVIQKG